MKLKLTIITITILLFSNIALKAQTDTSTFTPAHLAAARLLISTTGATEARFTMMRDNTIKAVSQSVPEKNREKFVVAMKAFLNKYLPSDGFREASAKMYASLFTESELKQLIEFYNSPIGKKVTSKLPEIMQNCMMMDQRLLIQHGDELQAIVNDSVKE